MTPEQLKASILQYAVQGRLVEQVKEEGNASTLIADLREAKNNLIKSKTIKREKDTDEKEVAPPFDIPETWEWVRVADCISNRSGLSYNKGNLEVRSDKMIRVMRGGNISDMSYCFKSDDVLIADKFVKSDLFLRKNTLITPAVTSLEHIGKMGRIEQDYDDTVVGGFVLMLTPHIDNDILAQYLLIAFSSPYFRDRCRKIVNKSGQAFYNLSREKMMQLFVPIPPLEEQHRIITKIEGLLPFVDRYAVSYEKLEQFNVKFPEDMKKSILQYAIQGKLVEQRPEEGNAEELYQQIQEEKQKLIKEGSLYREKTIKDEIDDDLPEIPETWKWCRLGELTKVITKGSSPKWQGVNYTDKENGILFVTSENVGNEIIVLGKEKYIEPKFNEMHPASILQKGDILTNIVGASIGRTAVFNLDINNANINQAVCIIRLLDKNLINYILKYLQSPFAVKHLLGDASDGGRPNLSLTSVTNLMIALPPLGEQHRIVAKIEELLPYCEQLIK